MQEETRVNSFARFFKDTALRTLLWQLTLTGPSYAMAFCRETKKDKSSLFVLERNAWQRLLAASPCDARHSTTRPRAYLLKVNSVDELLAAGVLDVHLKDTVGLKKKQGEENRPVSDDTVPLSHLHFSKQNSAVPSQPTCTRHAMPPDTHLLLDVLLLLVIHGSEALLDLLKERLSLEVRHCVWC